MGLYTAVLQRTGAQQNIGSVEAPAASMRRLAWTKVEFAIDTTPADATLTWQFVRTSTASSGAAVTPNPLNPADAACVAVATNVITTAGSTGVLLEAIALNQRATYTWTGYGEGELIVPATASNGIIVRNGASSALTATATVTFRE